MMCGTAQARDFSAPAEVIDGDTIRLTRDAWVFRLHGIDAPEIDQYCGDAACGLAARDWLAGLIQGDAVQCRTIGGKDRYGRYVAKCYHAGRDIGAMLVEAGYARAYLRYSSDYALLEKEAALNKRGFWAGEFGDPSQHRAAKVQPASVPEGCVVKGNISPNSGEKIYHVAGQQHYAKVSINTAKGEACFGSEAEARAAGWRKARR
ncbi:thermonuclease family protein [uncultured Litoreibacter sp.]|nr:thermonuclease family protein [uncultured Litoreibacter sp.]